MMSQAGAAVLIAVAVALVMVPVLTWRIRKSGRGPALRSTAADATLVVSLALIAALTLGGFGFGGAGAIELIPFRALFDAMPHGDYFVGLVVFDLLGNIVLFFPLGIALAIRSPRLSTAWTTMFALLLSVSIEAIQGSLLNRSADITDVICNVTGCLLGLVVVRFAEALWARYGSHRAWR